MSIPTYCIVAADTTTAKFYTTSSLKLTKPFILIKELNHPEGFKKNQELTSDKSGHYQTDHASRGSYEKEHSIKQIENDRFAKKIAEFLEKLRNSNQIHQLVVVAAPHFLGRLKKHFSLPVLQLIAIEVHKDYLHLTDAELQKKLHKKISSE